MEKNVGLPRAGRKKKGNKEKLNVFICTNSFNISLLTGFLSIKFLMKGGELLKGLSLNVVW